MKGAKSSEQAQSKAKEDIQDEYDTLEGDENESRPRPRGFQAFARPTQQGEEAGNVKTYLGLPPAVEPSTGIHSAEWASAVIPQSSSFLKLPVEIRLMIWSFVISSFNNHRSIEPHRHGDRFVHKGWKTAGAETNAISTICKQLYVEIVLSALLYKYKTFQFTSQVLFRQFMWSIKPSHKNAIQSIEICMDLDTLSYAPTKKVFAALGDLENFKHLYITLWVGVLYYVAAPWYKINGIDYKERFDLKEDFMSKVRNFAEWKLVTDLQTFRLEVFLTSTWSVPPERKLSHWAESKLRALEKEVGSIMYREKKRVSLT